MVWASRSLGSTAPSIVRALGTSEADFDAMLETIESKLPPPDLAPRAPRSRSIAVIVSSRGAQWEELMGWAMPLHGDFHLQLFTPEGRPVAFQRDSLSVSAKTAPLGFGCPRHLDPAGEAGRVAAELLGNTASTADFDATKYGAVYMAGGLGFNEDVAFAEPDGRRVKLTAHPSILAMATGAVAQELPMIAVCHGPTLFAAVPIEVNGQVEALNRNVPTASLPPFEGYVGFTGRKEIQFTYDVNTHDVLAATGGQTSVLADIANMKRVVKGRKRGIDIITGPGPQAARALATATTEAITSRWSGQ